MKWKIDAIIETRLESAEDEATIRKQVQGELWRLVELMEAALGTTLATSVHILGVEPLDEEAG